MQHRLSVDLRADVEVPAARVFLGRAGRTGGGLRELPVSSARQFDYTLHGALVWEF